MKRYVFYDPRTGRVLHTHEVVTAEGKTTKVNAEELAPMVERMVDVEVSQWLLTTVKPLSSRVAEQTVDTETGKLSVKRVDRPASRTQRRARAEEGE